MSFTLSMLVMSLWFRVRHNSGRRHGRGAHVIAMDIAELREEAKDDSLR